jgi:predicted nucleic acid-binding protein
MADRSQGILLDTSAIIAHFRGKIDLFELVVPEEPLFVSPVILGELYKGALKSGNPAKHQARIKELLEWVTVLSP